MAWIESHQTLGSHPKTRKLAHLLKVSKPAAIGHLHCLWWWAVDYAEDGDLSRFDALDIAIGAEWEGDEELFAEALVTAGFLDLDDAGGYQIHDWDDYAGKLIERRKANAERMRAARAERESGTTKPRATHVQRTQRARAERPDHTVPNQTEPGETPPSPPADAGAPEQTDPPVELKPTRRKPSRSIPDDFTQTPERIAIGVQEGLSETETAHEFRKFQKHAKATDRKQADWDASWQMWVLKAVEDRQNRAGSGPARASPAANDLDEWRRKHGLIPGENGPVIEAKGTVR